MVALLDDLDQTAAAVGAVNTVAMRDGRLIGYNTDMSGFRESMADGLKQARLERVLQLGAGGAGSAVATALLALGAGQLFISDIDPDRSAGLAEMLNARAGRQRVVARDLRELDLGGIDGIVNATPMGMATSPAPPLDPALVSLNQWVADIVYFPIETELLKAARDKGCAVLNGSGMVINQAALAFELITGHRADKQRMHASFFAK